MLQMTFANWPASVVFLCVVLRVAALGSCESSEKTVTL